jgi:hypothetical protein
MRVQKTVIYISLLSSIAFFALSSLAMYYYPGGTIHDRSAEGYQFWLNYFSDLGRTRSWNGSPNGISNLLFKSSLFLVSCSLIAFFLILPGIFRSRTSKAIAVFAAILGIISALCYIGIANNPLDVNYYAHTIYVRIGFISFLMMSFLFMLSIWSDPDYANGYALMLLLFCVILFIQVGIMLLGPRSWVSPMALRLQATAQKIVVYAEMICMMVQAMGVLQYLNKRKETA